MNPRRPPMTVAGVVLLVAGLGSGAVLVVALGRQVAFEKDRRERSETEGREDRTRSATDQHELKGARDRIRTLEAERENRARVVEGEMAALRRELAAAVKDRDEARQAWKAAAAERDRAAEDLVATRRENVHLRDDLARANEREAGAAEAAAKAAAASDEARRRLQAAASRVEALLRPLLQDLRSADGSVRVRAHEALSAWAGKPLPFRPGGTPEQIEADARAIEDVLNPTRNTRSGN